MLPPDLKSDWISPDFKSSLDFPSLALQEGGSWHMKPILTLLQVGLYVVYFLSSIDAAVNCLQISVILLPALHLLNKVKDVLQA